MPRSRNRDRQSPSRGRRAARGAAGGPSSGMYVVLTVVVLAGVVAGYVMFSGGSAPTPKRKPRAKSKAAPLAAKVEAPAPTPASETPTPSAEASPAPRPVEAAPITHSPNDGLTFTESDEGGEKSADMMSYVGGAGNQRFECAMELSDGTILIGGGADDMGWVPQGAKRIEVDGSAIEGGTGNTTGFILHVSKDLKSVLAVVEITGGKARNVSRIKSTGMPGAPTGTVYVSGARTPSPEGKKKDGYFIARLDGNFVDSAPTRLVWVKTFWAGGDVARNHPWDVGGDGKVVYVTGSPHGYDWLSVHRLRADGEQDVVPDWRIHWYRKPDGKGGEHYGPASTCPGKITHSGIVLKVWGRGDFRSWTQEEYLEKSSDGNGGQKQGAWPYDLMFSGPFDPKDPKNSPKGRGYTGYKWPGTPCGNCSAVAIDRRNNHMYLGGNNKSVLPGGNPDFEPYIISFTDTGKKKWWQRMYEEAKGVSTPDQYCDAIAIDYTKPYDAGALVAVARCHGNNVVNLWPGDSVKRAEKRGFQKGFTGTHGNMHIQWLGRMMLKDGELEACTYVAEFAEGAKVGKNAYSEPLLDGWPRFDSGWPDLNTTRLEPQIAIDGMGNVYISALGRRVLTTSNAWLKMPNPLRDKGAKGQWSDFVRVYKPDLSMPLYSSLVKAKWDWATGKGGSDVDVRHTIPVKGGLLLVGYSKLDKKTKQVTGDDMATPNLLPWGKKSRTGEMGVIGRLHFKKR